MYKCIAKTIRSIFLGLTVNELAIWLNILVSCELHECESSFQMIKMLPQVNTTLKVLSSQLPIWALSVVFTKPRTYHLQVPPDYHAKTWAFW